MKEKTIDGEQHWYIYSSEISCRKNLFTFSFYFIYSQTMIQEMIVILQKGQEKENDLMMKLLKRDEIKESGMKIGINIK